MQESALACDPNHFVRVKGGPCIDKVGQFYSSLLYMLDLG
jgi:hypothetical protein